MTLHVALGGRMVPFAGYEMPVQYPAGIIAEHNAHPRARPACSTSRTWARRSWSAPITRRAAAALEALVPADILGLQPGRQRYTQLLNDAGGILDDLMVTRSADPARTACCFSSSTPAPRTPTTRICAARCRRACSSMPRRPRAVALQGPRPPAVLARICPARRDDPFMIGAHARFGGIDCHVSRSGYTGEDGFEISVPPTRRRRSGRAAAGRRASSRSASARATRCASRPGSASTATTSTRPPRRSRPGSPGRSRSAAASRAAFPAPTRIQRELAERPGARARRPPARGPAPAREGTEIARPAGDADRHASPPAASARASTGRSPWATSRAAAPRPAPGSN